MTAITTTSYRTSSQAYLARARSRLAENSGEALFYAAFELRCGVQARLQEYLGVRMEVARKKRQGWRIPQLAKDLERVFRVGDTVVRVLVKSARGEVLLFFTPVSARLQRMAGRLNQLLHAQSARSDDDRWWEKTRQFLENVAEELQLASTGVLLGPPQIHVRTKEVNLNAVFTDAAEAALVTQVLGAPKTHLTIEVRYLKALPDLVKHGVAVKLASGSGAGDNAAPNPAS